MDQQRFDAALRALEAGTTRRAGLMGMLGVLVGGAGAARVAAGGPVTAGPCGDGSAKDNRCKANSDCCTKYCADGTCRCKPNWMECKKGEHCCSGACVEGRCDGGCKEAGGRCEGQFNCCDGLDCIKGACAKSKTVACSKKNCAGCCSGTMCRVGGASRACGTNGAACEACVSPKTCQGGACKGGGGCSAATCPNGCCEGGVCKGGTSDTACGKGGGACAACTGNKTCQNGACKGGGGSGCTSNNDCSGSTPVCSGGTCVGCSSNSDCPGSTPVCSGGTCVGCSSNSDCPSFAPICNSGPCIPVTWANQTTFGGTGAMQSPCGVHVSPNGLTAWVADYFNSRISIWTRPDAASTVWANQTTFGSYGTGDGKFFYPVGVVASVDGLTAWIADPGNNRISIWTRPDAASTVWTYQDKFGSLGTGDSQFSAPEGIFVSPNSLTAWVADTGNSRISIWTRPDTSSTTWTFQTKFGSVGSGDSQFNRPGSVWVSADGLTAFITDTYNQRISIWTRPDTTTNATAWTNQTTFGSNGSGSANFNIPAGIAASADGLTAWIADQSNNRISIWTRPDATSSAWANQTTFGSNGSSASDFSGPAGLFVESDSQTVWVGDSGNNRISVWIGS